MPAAFVLPKNMATAADRWYDVRERRLALQKEADALQAEETALKDHLIEHIPKSEATGISGKRVAVRVEQAFRFEAEDWDAVREYVRKNAAKNPGVWSIFQKRLGEEALKEMWAAGVKVPGVKRAGYKKLSYSSL